MKYVILINPDWWANAESQILIHNIQTPNYTGVPVIEDKWISNPPGYMLCVLDGKEIIPIGHMLESEE